MPEFEFGDVMRLARRIVHGSEAERGETAARDARPAPSERAALAADTQVGSHAARPLLPSGAFAILAERIEGGTYDDLDARVLLDHARDLAQRYEQLRADLNAANNYAQGVVLEQEEMRLQLQETQSALRRIAQITTDFYATPGTDPCLSLARVNDAVTAAVAAQEG